MSRYMEFEPREPERTRFDSPQSSEEARSAVERSRQRIAEDLDAIESRVEEKRQQFSHMKDQLKQKTGVPALARQTRSRPFPVLGAALGAGMVLGVTRSRLKERSQRREREAEEERERLEREREAAEKDHGSRVARYGRMVFSRPVRHQLAVMGSAAASAAIRRGVGRVMERRGRRHEYGEFEEQASS